MSVVSLPVTRPIGRALIVAAPAVRGESARLLREIGYECAEADEPYAAMRELCSQRLAYRAIILSLAGVYREELTVITAIKQRFPHIEVWLTQTDGRQAALADGVRNGADGLLAADGLHRIAPALKDQGTRDVANNTDRLPSLVARPAPPKTAAGTIGGLHFSTAPVLNGSAAPSALQRADDILPRPEQNADENPGDYSSDDISLGEPVLSVDELRALLQDQPLMPPSGSAE